LRTRNTLSANNLGVDFSDVSISNQNHIIFYLWMTNAYIK